jgi:hypothetical protein
MSIATSRLSEIAGAFVLVGIPLIAAAWFAGPARWAVRGRKAIAPFLRDRPEWTYAIVGAIMLLIFIWNPIPATGKVAGIIVFLALVLGTYLLRRQTARIPRHQPAGPTAARRLAARTSPRPPHGAGPALRLAPGGLLVGSLTQQPLAAAWRRPRPSRR